jgi:hypothetical protein
MKINPMSSPAIHSRRRSIRLKGYDYYAVRNVFYNRLRTETRMFVWKIADDKMMNFKSNKN